MVPVSWFDLRALPCFLRSFPGPFRADVLGRRVRGRSRKRCFWPGLPVGEAVRRRAGDRIERSGQRGGPESVNGRCSSLIWPSGRRLDHSPGLSLRYLGRPTSCVLSAWVELLRGSRSPRDPGFMNPIGAPEPPGDLSRIVWGIFFVLSVGARERTRGCSPRVVRVELAGGFSTL